MLPLFLACVSYLSFQGRLQDQKGAPIANASIHFEHRNATIRSDQNGYFTTSRMLLPETEYSYTISSLGYQPLEKTIRLKKKNNPVEEIILYQKQIYLPYRKRNIDMERE